MKKYLKLKTKKINIFFESRMLHIFLLGIISGFPWVLIGSTLTLWLKEDGLSRSTIGWAGLIFTVYAINYLWAPFVDKLKIPYFSKKIGHRKSWILLTQFIISLCLLLWVFADPKQHLNFVILIGLIIAICSSTQDISIDALRIELIKKAEKKLIAAGASISVVGWWTGFKIGGLLSLFASDFLQKLGYPNYWQISFIYLFFLILILNLLLVRVKETKTKNIIKHNKIISKKTKSFHFMKINIKNYFNWITNTILEPIFDFFKKNGITISIGILSFIFLFKIGEAFLGRMSIIFYKEIGFSKSDIGIFSKGLGWLTTIIFTILGGIFTVRLGILKSVVIAGIFMATTNILFSILYWVGKSYFIFSIAVILDDIAAAFATVAFVAFISTLINRKYTATQYALLASIGTFGRTTLAASSGTLVDQLDGNWGVFFIITALMVTPSLIILHFIKNKINFN